MATPNHDSPEVLRAEILSDGRREGEAIIRRAQQEAEALLTKAAAEADKMRQELLHQARADAARRKELVLATVAVEAGRLRSARVEALLESVHDEVRRQLLARNGFCYRETVILLAAEAMKQMPGSGFVVKLSAADHVALGDGLADDVARLVGRSPLNITISNDASLMEGGVIIEENEGRQVWDNRILARLERLWPELRRQIAIQTSLVVEGKPAGGGA